MGWSFPGKGKRIQCYREMKGRVKYNSKMGRGLGRQGKKRGIWRKTTNMKGLLKSHIEPTFLEASRDIIV